MIAIPSLPAVSPAVSFAMSSAAITLVGLGPGEIGDLTLAGWQVLTSGRQVIVRTRHHPCIDALASAIAPNKPESCDDLYEAHAEFEAVYQAISERVITCARQKGHVVYAVPGHPWVGEASTGRIVAQAQAHGLSVQIVGASSFVEAAFAAVGIDLMDGSQVVDAMLLARQHHPKVEVALPLLVAQVYARHVASDLKLTLLNAYPPDHPARLILAAGTAQQRVQATTLGEIDHFTGFDYLTSLYLPPLRAYSSFSELQELVAHLRAPEGCPWDRAQSLASLRHDLQGECAEVVEAIDADQGDAASADLIYEELGDLIMGAVLMVQVAIDEGRFQMADAMHSIITKMIRRHPHVFPPDNQGTIAVDGVEKVLVNWDVIKAQEKAAKGIQAHPLDGVPADLPALEKARVYQSKASKAGLLDRKAVASANQTLVTLVQVQTNQQSPEDAFGELLWQLVALAHQQDVNAEDALRQYVVRFREGFRVSQTM